MPCSISVALSGASPLLWLHAREEVPGISVIDNSIVETLFIIVFLDRAPQRHEGSSVGLGRPDRQIFVLHVIDAFTDLRIALHMSLLSTAT